MLGERVRNPLGVNVSLFSSARSYEKLASISNHESGDHFAVALPRKRLRSSNGLTFSMLFNGLTLSLNGSGFRMTLPAESLAARSTPAGMRVSSNIAPSPVLA